MRASLCASSHPLVEVRSETRHERIRTTRSSCSSCAAIRRSLRPPPIALTLRAVGGLTTAEIASAFLVPEATMAQRISRAKQTHQGLGRAVSACRRRASARERLTAVLHVLYLIFNEGYTSSIGAALQRTELVGRSDSPDARDPSPAAGRRGSGGAARADAADRCAPAGAHRSRWRIDSARQAGSARSGIASAIAEGVALVSRHAVPRERSVRISCRRRSRRCTTKQRRRDETDWPQILALYSSAEADVRQPDGVAQPRDCGRHGARTRAPGSSCWMHLDSDERLAGHYRLDAVRAHLLEKAGDHKAAIAHYTAAAGRTTSIPERDYLITQAARLELPSSADEFLNRRPGD